MTTPGAAEPKDSEDMGPKQPPGTGTQPGLPPDLPAPRSQLYVAVREPSLAAAFLR